MSLSKTIINCLICPKCKSEVRNINGWYQCESSICGNKYPIIDDVPILINEDNSIFSINDFVMGRPTTIVTRRSGSLANLLQKRQVNEKRRQTLINKAKEVQKDELGTDGQYWRRRLLDAEAKKDEAFAAQKKTTMPPGTGDTEFEGVFYNSPNWKKIKKAQNDIMHVKKEMEKRGYTVPNYSLDVHHAWIVG